MLLGLPNIFINRLMASLYDPAVTPVYDFNALVANTDLTILFRKY